MKVALYARVSKDDLHCENQKLQLDTWLERNKPDVPSSDYYQEEMSTRKTRPIKDSIMQAFREGRYDTIVVVQLFRFARSMTELVNDVEYIINNGGRFISIKDGFSFSKKDYNAAQQLQLGIWASFAQFEREIIRERTLDGLARARAQGKRLGRPRKIPPPNSNEIHEGITTIK